MKSQSRGIWLRQVRAHRTSYLMLLPFALLFLIFTVVPVCASVVLSFTNFNMVQAPVFTGFDNYSRLFLDDEEFLIALKNTIIFAFMTGPLGYVLSFVFAWCINEFPAKLRALLTLIFYAPSLAGNVYYVWTYIFSGDRYGLINSYLISWGFLHEPIQWLTDTQYTMGVCIIVVVWLSMGTGFLSFVAGLQNLDRQYYEAAALDGVRNRFQELWYVTLPMMAPHLMLSAVLSITATFTTANVATVMTGFPSVNYATHTVMHHLQDYATIRYERGYASAIATVLFLMSLLMNKLAQKVIGRLGK